MANLAAPPRRATTMVVARRAPPRPVVTPEMLVPFTVYGALCHLHDLGHRPADELWRRHKRVLPYRLIHHGLNLDDDDPDSFSVGALRVFVDAGCGYVVFLVATRDGFAHAFAVRQRDDMLIRVTPRAEDGPRTDLFPTWIAPEAWK